MLPKDIFKRHTHIGIDLDETLAESVMDGLEKLHSMNKMKSIKTFEHITSFDWTDFPECDMTHDELVNFWKSHHLHGVQPVHGSIDSIFTLFQYQKYLHVVTARNEHDHRRDTENWLKIYFPEIHPSNIHFANHFARDNQKKSTICKSIGVTLRIDDGLHNALDLAENHIECILLDKPWNRREESNHPLIHRVYTWQEIIDNLR
jgi:5'(3')-deoxyribonucleotidase